jgi:hypothetical protein
MECVVDFLFYAEKVIYHSEKFDSKFFLARIHQNTSAYDLEAAGDALKRDLQSRKEQLKKLVKENFDCFISCKNTIDGNNSIITWYEWAFLAQTSYVALARNLLHCNI